jgi:amino acid transporter
VFLWIESQSTPVIVLLVLSLCYSLTGLVFVVARILPRYPLVTHLKATTPSMLTPLAAILALIIAFLAARVWANLDHANTYAAQEASAINETILLSSTLPGELPSTMRNSIHKYIHFVAVQDEPAMKENRAELRLSPPGLTDGLDALLSFNPATPGQRIAQERSEAAIERILEARRDRIVLSEATIEPIQWIVILILSTLVLLVIAMVHIYWRVTVALNLFLFSTAVAVCLILLMVNGRPFSHGGASLDLRALQQVDPIN